MKYKGRKPTARAKAEQVRELRKAGMGATEIGQHLRMVGQSSPFTRDGPSSDVSGHDWLKSYETGVWVFLIVVVVALILWMGYAILL